MSVCKYDLTTPCHSNDCVSCILSDIKSECWDSGMNMTGEYQGVWVRYRDIEKIIDKRIKPQAESED